MTDDESFAALLGEFEQKHKTDPTMDAPKVGDKVHGRIVSIGEDQAFVDLGGKSEGIIELDVLKDADGNLEAKEGETVEAIVTSIDSSTGTIILGSRQPRTVHGSAELEQAFHNRLPVEGQVTGVIKGGVEVQIAGVRAFCPVSQLDIRYVEEPEGYVGQKLAFRITKFEGGKHVNLVVSRRVLLEEEQQELAEETRAVLEEGAILQGTVTSLKEFGAFVDIGGIQGMIHVSELGFGRVKHPSEVLTPGQQVEVAVLRIEKTDDPRHPEKIALSIRALADDPWMEVERLFPVGTTVRGKVSRLQPFGAFVELTAGVEGLVHISEMGVERRIGHPREVVSEGSDVEARVLSIDREKRRIGLSLDTTRSVTDGAGLEGGRNYTDSPESFGTLGDLLRESMDKQK